MARPLKLTVDYFPHFTKHGKTMQILESKFGNDGYSVFFKTLEILGRSEGHYLNLNDPDDLEYHAVYCNVDEEKLSTILDLLARRGTFDAVLWSNKIVWSDHFVENLFSFYENRKSSQPLKPDYQEVKRILSANKLGFDKVKPLQREGKGREGKKREEKNNKETEINKDKESPEFVFYKCSECGETIQRNKNGRTITDNCVGCGIHKQEFILLESGME